MALSEQQYQILKAKGTRALGTSLLVIPELRVDFSPSRSFWRQFRICRDLFYIIYDISWIGICTNCRKKLAMLMKGVAANKTDEDEPEVRRSSRLAEKSPVSFENLFLPPETSLPPGQEFSLGETPETPGYQPSALHRDQVQCKEEDESLKKLNEFLVSRDCSPVRYRVRGMLSEAAERTKREHLRKVRQGIVAVVGTIAPGQEDETWAELTRSGILDAQFNARKIGRMQIETDHSMHALAAAYRQSEARVTKLQILSIIVDIFPQRQIQDLLPEITKYQLFQAKKHFLFRVEEGNPYQLFLNTVLA